MGFCGGIAFIVFRGESPLIAVQKVTRLSESVPFPLLIFVIFGKFSIPVTVRSGIAPSPSSVVNGIAAFFFDGSLGKFFPFIFVALSFCVSPQMLKHL